MDSTPASLPRAPGDALGPTGEPRVGAYAGSLGQVDLTPLAPLGLVASLRHAARQKRWQRLLLAGPSHLLALEILDAGSLAGGTVWIADRTTGEVLFDRSAPGLTRLNVHVGPHPGAGARASFDAPGIALSLERRSDRFQLQADLGDALHLELLLDAGSAPEPWALVEALPDDGLRAVQVAGPLEAVGQLTVRGRPLPLQGGLVVLDYGAGLFPRNVAWRKLTAVGRLAGGQALALHLVEGEAGPDAAGPSDGALLLGRGPMALPPVAFQSDAGSPTGPWRVTSADGRVDLAFRPLADHRDVRELFLVSLRTEQLAGELSGRLPGPDGAPLEVAGLAALVEERTVRW